MKKVSKTIISMFLVLSMILMCGCGGKNEVISNAMTGEEFSSKMAKQGFTISKDLSEPGINTYIATQKHLSAESLKSLEGKEENTFTTEELQAMEWVESTVLFYIYEDAEDAAYAYEKCLQVIEEKQQGENDKFVEEETKAYCYSNDWYMSVSVVENTSMIVSVQEGFVESIEEAFAEEGY